MTSDGKAVLVTGASTGIGQAAVLRLDRLGFRVFGTVRSEQDAQALREKTSDRVTPIYLDLTDQESIRAVVTSLNVELESTGLAGLVNNAGISIGAPVEVLAMDDLRLQMEINLFGQVALTQALIPLLRQAHGRIVFVSSVAGRMAFPYQSPYSMSKFALEALADALRIELLPWKIHTSIIEPGSIDTPIWGKGSQRSAKTLSSLSGEALSGYGPALQGLSQITHRAIQIGIPPDRVARAITHALTSRWPQARYIVGLDAHLLLFAESLPDPIRDWLVWTTIRVMARQSRT